MKTHIDQKLASLKASLTQSFEVLNEVVLAINNENLKETAREIFENISEPFMFVIVGEVKAGKSSFINALLESEKEICKVAPAPMTDTIQQITFGEERTEVISPFLKKIYQPVEILKEITIVDTPGTNTIVAHHQEITERFIPSSDLIVFVFEAKNPYRQSSWEFFDFIHSEWHKKIIFVLQQKDLLNAQDLKVNIEGVLAQAEKKGISQPKVFAVSAKLEIEGNHSESGFISLRNYLKENITGGKTPYLKLISSIVSGEQLMVKISEGIKDRRLQYESDMLFRKDIKDTLDQQEEKSVKQVEHLIENLLNAYDKATLTRINELKDGLSIIPLFRRSFASIFTSTKSIKDWLEEVQRHLERDLNKNLKDKLQEGVVNIADSIQNMAKIIDLKIKSSKTILKNDHQIFGDIAEKRANVLKDLQDTFKDFLNRTENYYDDNLMSSSSITPNLLAGGGIAAIGVIIATITNLSILDITGGILTAVGVAIAGFSIGFKKKKIVTKIQEEIDRGRNKIELEITEKLTSYIAKIKYKIDENFDKFDLLLKNEEIALNDLMEKEKTIKHALKSNKEEINKLI